ncbi:MAG: hypothetical protein LBE86_00550 [Gemmobacter sp.]|jgi:hypothetical protein|nr:hypothetical protein [Gemmobacter sp.]
MKRLILLLPVLAACGTPQEQCIRQVTRDQRVVERLIAESEATLRRGYAIETTTTTVTRWVPCRPGGIGPDGKPRPPRMCLDDHDITRSRPRAVDLAAEAVKLDQLRVRRAQQIKENAGSVEACRRQYPQ